MSSSDSINPMPDVTTNSWFVEDITLATTTLRYARTNEVSTVNNWSLAGTRIVNCARSPRATVHLEFTAHISILENKKLEIFQAEIKRYVEEHPRVWDSVAHIRHDHFDADQERIDFTMSLRHRSSWQEAGRIKLDRSHVYRFLFELGKKLEINFSSPPDQRIVYSGGNLKRGDNDDCYMRELLAGSNLVSAHPKAE
jgi:Mechanosensitive ion channel